MIIFFGQARPQSEGRRHTDPGIKLPPVDWRAYMHSDLCVVSILIGFLGLWSAGGGFCMALPLVWISGRFFDNLYRSAYLQLCIRLG